MISVNHPSLGVSRPQVPENTVIARIDPILYRVMQATNQISPPHQTGPSTPVSTLGPVESSAGSSVPSSSGSLPIQVSDIVDPVTGVTYAGYLTQDAQALYQSGSLLTGGTQLTPQGSALAAQGDLIQGTPAPSATQIAQAQPVAAAPGTDFFSSIETWLASETLWTGIPNGAVAAGGVIALAWIFGGKKKRR